MRKYLLIIIGTLFVIGLSSAAALFFALGDLRPALLPPSQESRTGLNVPRGFEIDVFADNLANARDLIRGPGGVLLVSQPKEGRVVALSDENGDGKAEQTHIVVDKLTKPHGLAFRCPETGDYCYLYVAEEQRVAQYRYDARTHTAVFDTSLMDLPADGGHTSRSLLTHPDNERLLISVGSSCNVCLEGDERRAAIIAYNLQTGTSSLFATGLRNTVFMETHYVTGDVWGTDMGRDLLGDDLPPDEINILREGGNFGWPFCYGKNIHDTDYDQNTYIRAPCTEPFEIPSHLDVPAHSAPLGIAFIPEEGWPEEWWYDALVAYHGSWNRSEPTGYKVVRIPLDANGNPEGDAEDFIAGFLPRGEERAQGRPVDLLIEPGGTLYMSDDHAGKVWKLSRTRP